jgi:hypothetical protein
MKANDYRKLLLLARIGHNDIARRVCRRASKIRVWLWFICIAGCITLAAHGGTLTTNSQQIIKVYLQGGQSNAGSPAATNGLPANLLAPQPDVAYYYYFLTGPVNGDGTLGLLTTLRPTVWELNNGDHFGPELTFGRTLADFYGLTNRVPVTNVMVAIIKYSRGGTTLYQDWAAGGDSSTNNDGADYITFQTVVSAGLAHLAAAYPGATLEMDGMIWVQGESDIDPPVPNPAVAIAYGTNLTRFIKDARLTWGAYSPYGTNLPFFLSRISTNQTTYSNPTGLNYTNYLLVRAGQAAVAATVSNAFMIDTDGDQFTVRSSDHIHFDTGGQLALGGAFAKTLIGALPRPQIQSLAKSGNGWRVTFMGISGLNYSLERSKSLLGTWTALTNLVTGSAGITNFDDQNAPDGGGFYRVSHP